MDINKITLFLCIVIAVATLLVPKKYLVIPFLITSCFIPVDQRIIIMNVDFTVLRIIVLAGILRLFIRNEMVGLKKSHFDILLFFWLFFSAFIYILQWGNAQAIINRAGVMFDVLGLYWIFRQAISSWKEISFIAKTLAICALISVIFVVFERITKRNLFDYLGQVETGFHRGRYRCRGPFPHSIMLGLFWTLAIPLFYAFACCSRQKGVWISAIIASLIITVLSGSSTPIIALGPVFVFLALYKYRYYCNYIFWCICGMLIILHFLREPPIWHLVARIDVFGGSTGWHRYHLMDQAIKRFGEWAFLGTRSTAHWGYGLADVTNQYILEGVRGGFITMLLFIILMTISVRIAHKYSIKNIPSKYQLLSWCICVTGIAHITAFFAVSYFGQVKMALYMYFAIIGFLFGHLEEIEKHKKMIKLKK